MPGEFKIVKRTEPTVYFIGVTTGSSAMMRIFPQWMDVFGRPEVKLVGVDCKIHDEPWVYRQAVAQIKYDPLSLGAVITTHKIDLLNASRDLFDTLDPYAQVTGEISCISKLDGRLEGQARDPISVGLCLEAMIGPDYFGRSGGEVLSFGAGGAAMATLLCLAGRENKADRPRRFMLVDRVQSRLDYGREMAASLKTDINVETILNDDPDKNDEIMAAMPEGSLVINATGMGKDTPGSPITWNGVFPMNGIAWEFNYRGELDFLQQAEAQAKARRLKVEDGWRYFVTGWAQVLIQVLHVNLTRELFKKLEKTAEGHR